MQVYTIFSVETPFLEHLFWYFLCMLMYCYCLEKTLFAYYILFLSLKTLRTTLLSLLFMREIPTFALLFQNFEPYFISTFSVEGT